MISLQRTRAMRISGLNEREISEARFESGQAWKRASRCYRQSSCSPSPARRCALAVQQALGARRDFEEHPGDILA